MTTTSTFDEVCAPMVSSNATVAMVINQHMSLSPLRTMGYL